MEEKFLGQGIVVAVLDTGIVRHPDFGGRIKAFADFVNGKEDMYDDSGHGTHVAGIIAGNGMMSGGRYRGVAPGAGIAAAKVLDRLGEGSVRDVQRAAEWIMEKRKVMNIRIVNISVGAHPEIVEKEEKNLLAAVEMLWDEGLTVVTSAGNYGPEPGSVSVPGSSRKVITVGAENFIRTKRYAEWNYSGQGPTKECVIKPDIVAPGVYIMSCNARFSHRGSRSYVMKTGTSMAAPAVSGAIACLLSKYPDMTNVEVKLHLRKRCPPENGEECGRLNVERLLK